MKGVDQGSLSELQPWGLVPLLAEGLSLSDAQGVSHPPGQLYP